MAEEEKDTKEEVAEAAPAAEEKKEEAAPKVEETKAEEKKAEVEEKGSAEEEKEVEVPAQFKKIVEEIEKMTVLELNELVKVFEQKFGVSATAVATSGGGAGEAGGDDEKSEFTVELTSIGDAKIQVIKAVKEVLGLGLKEAKDMVEGAPTVLKEGVKKAEAEEWKTKIEEAGGSVELK